MGGVFQSVLYLEPVVDDTPVDVEQDGRSVTTRRKGRRAAGMCVLVLGGGEGGGVFRAVFKGGCI